MPQVLIAAWQDIWQMTDDDFGGKRNYITDFEIYHQHHSEIYIGITPPA
jgi:predicted transcriptional regulator YdeE